MVTQTQEEQPSEWESWTYNCNACEQGWQESWFQGEKSEKEVNQGEDQGVLQEGHLIWGETIIGVGIVNK